MFEHLTVINRFLIERKSALVIRQGRKDAFNTYKYSERLDKVFVFEPKSQIVMVQFELGDVTHTIPLAINPDKFILDQPFQVLETKGIHGTGLFAIQ